MQAWDFGYQLNHESLSSAVPAILALLLKTIANLLELHEFGLVLCRALLRETHLKLVVRGLGAQKEKEHVISPCLRLLAEVASFDGGALANRVYDAKTFTLDPKLMQRCLSMGPSRWETGKQTSQRPTVRSNCIRYLLQLLKFCSSSAKAEIIKTAPIVKSLFGHVSQDSTLVLSDLLEGLKSNILKDPKIPRSNKSFLLTDQSLSHLAALYRKSEVPTAEVPSKNLDLLVHDFLSFVCTDPDAGVLRRSSGVYPQGIDQLEKQDDVEVNEIIDLGLDSIEWYSRFDRQIPVSNSTLSKFSRGLRPYSSPLECDLLISIFRTAPELVADYFRNTNFAFDPKLSATWIGYASFLFAAIRIAMPKDFGRNSTPGGVPPPISIMLDNIIPPPMSSQVMTRCLNQSSNLITFIAVRLLLAAFEKLRVVLNEFKSATKLHGDLWKEGQRRLLDGFLQRCPNLKDILSVHKQHGDGSHVQKEAALRLIVLYNQVAPHLAAEQKFDVALPLAQALQDSLKQRMNHTSNIKKHISDHVDDAAAAEDVLSKPLHPLQLSSLLRVASYAPDTRWFHKPESLHLSPFTSLIQMCATRQDSLLIQDVHEVLFTIAGENDIFQNLTDISPLRALIATLRPNQHWSASDDLYAWLDDAIQRMARWSIKYRDSMDTFLEPIQPVGDISPIWITFREQWEYAVEHSQAGDEGKLQNIYKFLLRYSKACQYIGEDGSALKLLSEDFARSASSVEHIKLTPFVPDEEHIAELKKNPPEVQIPKTIDEDQVDVPQSTTSIPSGSSLDARFFAPESLLSETASSTALHAAVEPPVSELNESVRSGSLSNLILCLSSSDEDVSTQALTNIRTFAKKLSGRHIDSEFASAKQIWLLLGILNNTATSLSAAASAGETDGATPVPYIITAFAAMAAPILTDPRHSLYEPINKFLLRSPVFKEDRMLRHWYHHILKHPPSPLASRTDSEFTKFDPNARTDADGQPLSLPPLPLTSLAAPSPFKHDAYLTQLHFLISFMYHSVRTMPDLKSLRRSSNVLETLLTLTAGDAYLPRGLKELVVALIWRISSVEGGADLLITRWGIIGWLQGMVATRGGGRSRNDVLGKGSLRELTRNVWENCDKERVNEWASTDLEVVVREVATDSRDIPLKQVEKG